MAVRSELFVSTRRQAKRFSQLRATLGSSAYDPVDARGLAPLEFERLSAILGQKDHDPDALRLVNVRFGQPARRGWAGLVRRFRIWIAIVWSVVGGEGPDAGLYRFPPAYLRLLAGLQDTDLPGVAKAWADTEAMAGRDGTSAQAMLIELRRLARSAEATRRGLFLWGATVPEGVEQGGGGG
jgi:hypothetical protein